MKRGRLVKLIVVCSIVFLFLSISGCIRNGNNKNNETGEDWRDWPIVRSSVESESGSSSENSSKIEEFDISDYYITKVIIELTWEDEPSNYFNGTNEPDYFNFTVYTPWGEVHYSEVNSSNIREEIEVPKNDIANNSAIGEWIVNIYCGECGDDNDSIGFRKSKDSGNDWELSYYYEYHSGEVGVRW